MALMPEGLSLEPAWLQTLEPRVRWRPGFQQLALLADWMALMPEGLSLGPAWLQTLEPWCSLQSSLRWWGPLEPASS